MKYKLSNILPSDARGVTLIEILIVLTFIAIMASVSLFYLSGHQKLYKPDEQALKLVDILQEARQRSLTQRRIMRVEINSTARTARLINENGAGTSTDDTELRRITLLSNNEVRIDTSPANITDNPPETLPVPAAVYKKSSYPGSVNDQVCTIRFRPNGSVVDGGTSTIGDNAVPTGVTLYGWSPAAVGSNQSSIARAITILGASGSIRLWEFDANSPNANKWKDSRRIGAYAQ